MKKLVVLALATLLCGMGCLQAQVSDWDAWWIIVNATSTREGAYAVVTTHEKNQDLIAVLNPGDTGSYPEAPTNISVYSTADNRLLKSIPGPTNKKNPIWMVIGGQTSETIHIDLRPHRLSDRPDRLYLLNATRYDATYSVHFDVCRRGNGSLLAGDTALLRTGECRFSKIDAYFNVKGTIVSTSFNTPFYADTGGQWGLYVFQEYPINSGTFKISGPWQSGGQGMTAR